MSRPDVFLGQSSRRNAHNTDDLFERWLLRRGGNLRPLSEILPPGERDLQPSPFTVTLTTEARAREQLAEAVAGLRKTNDLLGGMAVKDKGGVRERLIARKEELLKYIRSARQFLREWSESDNYEELQRLVGEGDPELESLARKLLALRGRGKNAPRLSDEEYQRLDQIGREIRDKLMARKLG